MMNLPFEDILKLIGSSGLLGLTDISSPENALAQLGGGVLPGAAASGGIPGAIGAALGGGIPGALAGQVPLGDIADAVGSVARQGGAAGAVLGALPVARNLPAAAALSAAGGAAGGVMDEQERMRRMLMGLYT